MIVLGCTGSIGVNTLEIAKQFDLHIEVLCAGNNIALLNGQLQHFNPKVVVIANKEDIDKVDHENVQAGDDAILNAIEKSSSNIVVNALVGFVGLAPTLKAIECGKKIALANKESLVVAGKFIDTSNITPIDSEHFGLWYLMDEKKDLDSLTITASGGSFRDYPLDKLSSVTVKEALNHPNWSMGNKITIDSATMTNKLFELIEARWLFGTTKCDAIIETKSIIHAMINFTDGSTTAHLAHANMKLPIAYALMGKVDTPILDQVDLVALQNLEFKKIQKERYHIWEVKDELLHNENLGVVLNAANEVAVDKFLKGDINFLDIAKISLDAINKFHHSKLNSVDDIFEIDTQVRRYCNG
ncbi:MAG: 1-deoxy-D-xylulose-5-phosphate reductoisomerase [Campylobacterota bacterium]|nr:1-deoxy-D-xylulose-5-phosphate reductoisomerase [Campylobacterota bacterium]